MRQAAQRSIRNGVDVRPFSARPLYLQARDAIAQRIAAGEWKPSTSIPNEGDLAREFGISAGTVRKALDLLEAEHLLTRRQGRGTFVNDTAAAEHAVRFNNLRARDGTLVRAEVQILNATRMLANDRERARLCLSHSDRVHRVRRVRLADGKPFMLEDVAMPAALFPALAAHIAVFEPVTCHARHAGVLLGKAEERVTIGSAAPDVASALQIAPAATLMVLDRIIYTLDGAPAEWRVGQCVAAGRFYCSEIK